MELRMNVRLTIHSAGYKEILDHIWVKTSVHNKIRLELNPKNS
jgi:hypothetical protein